MNLNKILYRAEKAADFIVLVKEKFLNDSFKWLVPSLTTRQKSKKLIQRLTNRLSKRISLKIDKLIEANIITVPNTLSLSRAFLGPIFFIFQQYEVGLHRLLIVMILAMLTDYLDGYLARKMNQETELGAMCDAGCDKLFALSVGISFLPNIWWWNFMGWLILDSTLATLAWLVWRTKQKGIYYGQTQIKANRWGQIKYNLQGIAGLCFLGEINRWGNYFLILANLFALASLLRHLKPKTQNNG